MVQPLSLKATSFAPTSSLTGSEPATLLRAKNVVIRGIDGRAKIEAYRGSLDLGETYDIDITPAYQIETATVQAAAGITSDGNALVSVMIYDVGYGILVPLTAAAHTTADLIAQAVRDAIEADEFLAALFIVGGTGPDVSITDRHYHQNDLFRNLAIENAPVALSGCAGITNPTSSVSTLQGVAGFRITGTVAFDTSTTVVTGTGTKFRTELHPGQLLQAGGEPFWVNLVNSDTEFIAERAPTTTQTGQIGRCFPIMFEIDHKRGVMKRGTAIIQDRGDIIMVGDGELYLNGTATGFSASRRPCRLERATDGTYSKKFLGFAKAPIPPSITTVGAGTKGMTAGNYSFMVSFYNSVTRGYSNPCPVIKLNAASTPITIGAGDRLRFDFTYSIAGRPPNADGFTIWASPSGTTGYAEGPWYRCRDVLFTELDGSYGIEIEYLDAELGEVVSGDNNPPPECEFVTEFANTTFYISALGKTTDQATQGTSPGPYVLATKPGNREAAPTRWRIHMGYEITGFALGSGRLFCQTTRGIPFVAPAGASDTPSLTPTATRPPFTMRPFWTKGGISPYGLDVIQSDVFVMSGSQALRSPSAADDENLVPYELGHIMRDLFNDVPNGHFIVKHDPKNQQACIIASAVEQNANGYWISHIYPYDMQRNRWMPPITLDEDDRDMIVSGAAVVNDRLEFLAGGRVAGGTHEVRTYRYDEPSGEDVEYYFAFQPTDLDYEEFAKMIKWYIVEGRLNDFKLQVHGTNPQGIISIDDIEDGTNSLSGDILIENSEEIQRRVKKRHLTKTAYQWCIRASGVSPADREVDRVDEIVVGVGPHGGKG